MSLLYFFEVHWIATLAGLALLILCAVLDALWIKRKFPADTTANGIVIGQVKAFDNRSLALRIERLNASLETFKVVNQNVTENLGNFQEQTSTETSRSFSLGVKANPTKAEDVEKAKSGSAGEKAGSNSTPAPGELEGKRNVGLAVGDLLSNQLNLASQIFNLQTLYERSLSDRLIDGRSRLQTVLGFQVSITPPTGYADCAAIAEIGVRMKTGPDSWSPVSLVALMPQEKTYNAESLSSSAESFEGSAVAKVMTMGFTSKGASRELFVHRDSDTIAFERDSNAKPGLFETNASIFGWEFRPVLGRRAVSPGTRQMLALVAVPAADEPVDKRKTDKPKQVKPEAGELETDGPKADAQIDEPKANKANGLAAPSPSIRKSLRSSPSRSRPAPIGAATIVKDRRPAPVGVGRHGE